MYGEQAITLLTDDEINPVVRVTYHQSGLIVHRGFIQDHKLNAQLVEVLFFRIHPELTQLFDVIDGWKRDEVEMFVEGWDCDCPVNLALVTEDEIVTARK